ncbi:MAG: RNA polymerase sigma factor [Gammaproteobacteria bacterium]|nr:RNA polymerase sigma factor [Gammaproteobacteria bacterium]
MGDHRGARIGPLFSVIAPRTRGDAVDRCAVERTIEAVWHIESAKIIAKLARMLRDVGRAEEIAQDAWVAALEQWSEAGVPENPGAWLMTTAKNRAIDQLRRHQLAERKHVLMTHDTDNPGDGQPGGDDAESIADDLLRLIFAACHPVIPLDGRIALTLRLVAGLSVAEIARAFVASEPTIQQRIVRAKRTLSDARVPFEVLDAADRGRRLESVLEVIYLIFNEGYAATSGEDWMRPALCEEALRVGRILAEIAPNAAEVHGLVALMELQASRTAARTSASGEPVLLLHQDRASWDRLLIHRGLAALASAESLDGPPGPYTLQAAIAACHARALRPEDTDWPRIATLYDALLAAQPSPIVALNRAVAISMASGPAAALEIVDGLREDPRLRGYHLVPSVRGDLLDRLGRFAEARAEFSRAASLARNAQERRLLLRRAADHTVETPAEP